jgi:hypothetical protein
VAVQQKNKRVSFRWHPTFLSRRSRHVSSLGGVSTEETHTLRHYCSPAGIYKQCSTPFAFRRRQRQKAKGKGHVSLLSACACVCVCVFEERFFFVFSFHNRPPSPGLAQSALLPPSDHVHHQANIPALGIGCACFHCRQAGIPSCVEIARLRLFCCCTRLIIFLNVATWLAPYSSHLCDCSPPSGIFCGIGSF